MLRPWKAVVIRLFIMVGRKILKKMEVQKILKRLKNIAKMLKVWNRNSLGYAHMRIREIEEKL